MGQNVNGGALSFLTLFSPYYRRRFQPNWLETAQMCRSELFFPVFTVILLFCNGGSTFVRIQQYLCLFIQAKSILASAGYALVLVLVFSPNCRYFGSKRIKDRSSNCTPLTKSIYSILTG